ncbi:hypothetical protein Pint_20052 [Pistacia integerrima]|uniref:Uncharacterized protein n=1 Tax=Pistacia integerrima TaxID=434235 RepID=A0ACC0XBK5_9ROSI|nr:hypothetical protein Pint_20052 [Pistacia integerrima]
MGFLLMLNLYNEKSLTLFDKHNFYDRPKLCKYDFLSSGWFLSKLDAFSNFYQEMNLWENKLRLCRFWPIYRMHPVWRHKHLGSLHNVVPDYPIGRDGISDYRFRLAYLQYQNMKFTVVVVYGNVLLLEKLTDVR